MTAQTFHALLRQKAHVFITTIMSDGSPHTTMTWVDTDGDHALVNIPAGTVKDRNTSRDPRVSLAIADPDNPRHYFAARGTVVARNQDHDMSHINQLAVKYLGTPFSALGGPAHERLILTIRVDALHEMQ
jgi:PPOX class probable F420-dependent enzyme